MLSFDFMQCHSTDVVDDLPVYYTIMWDPRGTGQMQFYDRTFLTEPGPLLERIQTEFNRNLFTNVIVAEVRFTKIS